MKLRENSRRIVQLLFVIVLIAVYGISTAGAQTASSAEDEKIVESYLVTAEWLKENASKVIIIDARSRADYAKGHIPGAVNKHWTELSDVSVKQSEPGWAILFPQEKLAKIFGELGIDGKKPVVVYNDPLVGWGEEGRVLWTLRVFGLTDTYILNGGLQTWKASGGTVTKKKPKIKKVILGVPVRNDSLFASTDYVASNLGEIQLLDVREREEYNGKKNYGEVQNGRIPGSVWFWYKDFYNTDGTIKTPSELRAIFYQLGLSKDKETVAYCTGGIRSGFSTIVLKLAGYRNAKNYDGSFSEWTATNQKIEK